MHRLFVALRPPPPLRRLCLETMAGGPAGWAWQDEEQLHVTLRFIGEVDRPMAEDIAAAMGTIHSPALEIGFDGVGFFDQGPRGALFARISPREPLAALHKKIDRALVSLGLKPEGRAYLPHLTLARKRRGADDPAGWLAVHAGLRGPAEPIEHFILFESRVGRDGSRYEPIERYQLGMSQEMRE